MTCSVFAPSPQLVFDHLDQSLSEENTTLEASASASTSTSKFNTNSSFKKDKQTKENKSNQTGPGYVIISGDYDGEIKVFYNAVKPKHSSLPT